MRITSSQLENVKELKNVSAVSSYGTGLLTTIVSSFAEVFGFENNMLGNKIIKAKNSAVDKLVQQASKNSNAVGIMNLRFEVSRTTVFAYGTVYGKPDTSNADSFDGIPEI